MVHNDFKYINVDKKYIIILIIIENIHILQMNMYI